ncbi:glycosyltransferase [Patescibacteria group bacterium]
MKILMIGTSDITGGAAKLSWDLGENLRKSGVWVRHIVGYKDSDSPHAHQLKVFLHKNISKNLRHLRSYVLANDQNFGLDEEIINHPWYVEADIIHIHNIHGNFISLEALQKISIEKKVVWTLHDMWPITSHCAYTKSSEDDNHNPVDCNLKSYPPILWDNKKNLWSNKLQKIENSNINFVSPSKWLQKKFLQTMKNNTVIHISNGVDTNIFKKTNKARNRKVLNLPKDKKIALFISQGGKKNSRKGWNYVEGLSNKHKDTVFLTIGGKEDKTSENLVFRSNIKDMGKLASYYSAADVFLFPSLADNCPLTVLEAKSTGTPILAFDVGGVGELIEHKRDGYLAKYKNKKDLEKGFSYLLNKKPSKNNGKKHSVELMTEKYQKLYSEL